MNAAPTLHTERLTLRGHTAADFDDYLALISDPVVMRFISPTPTTREIAWARLLRYPGTWALFGFGMWIIQDRASGCFLGEVGFLASKRELQPSTDGTLEMGWLLAADAHGKGIGSEAVKSAIGWAEEYVPGMRMTCIIDPDNMPSLRVAAKFGFREFARTNYHEKPIILFERRAGQAPPL